MQLQPLLQLKVHSWICFLERNLANDLVHSIVGYYYSNRNWLKNGSFIANVVGNIPTLHGDTGCSVDRHKCKQ